MESENVVGDNLYHKEEPKNEAKETTNCHFGTMKSLLSPLNLSPRDSEIEGEKISKLSPIPHNESPKESPNYSLHCPTPPNSWTGLCRTPYFFPPFPPLPFLYPLADSTTSSYPRPLTTTAEDGNSPVAPHDYLLNGREENGNIFQEKSSKSPIAGNNGRDSPHHYQVKWSNHASRLSSFISSLEGDAASSDAVISMSDGATFYAHRLVLASSSPFFKRTLKNIPKDQHAVIVIPRAPSRCIATILSFCYNGKTGFPKDDLKTVMELAEDLEITGMFIDKDKPAPGIPRSQASTSPVFPISPSINPDSSRWSENWAKYSQHTSPLASHQTWSSSHPPWKRRVIGYNEPMPKRVKSESDASKPIKKPLKSRKSEPIMNYQPNSSADLSTPLVPHQKPPSFHNSKSLANFSFDNSYPMMGIIPRQAGTGSRVLLWKFLLQLLHDHRYSPYYIRWLYRSDGVFRIMESDKVAQLWGMARKNRNMTYEKMSRGMRTYYKRSILFHLDGTKLIYRFNIHEPEIQQQLKYYDLMSQRQEKVELPYEIECCSLGQISQTSPTTKSDLMDESPSSIETPSCEGTPNAPLSPHFLADVSSSPYSYGSLFSTTKAEEVPQQD